MSEPAREGEPARKGDGVARIVTLIGLAQIVTFGILFYAFALLAPRILAETGWEPGLVYGGFSLAMVTAGLVAPAVGALIDRNHGRTILMVGPVIGAAGLALLAISHSPAVYLASFVVVGLGMATSLYDPAFATIGRRLGLRARRAISAVTLLGGFASTVFWPLTRALLTDMDWRMVAFLYAGLLIVIAVPLHGLAFQGRPVPLPADPDDAAQPAIRPLDPPASYRTLILFAVVVASHGFVTSAMSVHLIPLLGGLGISERDAVIAGMLIGPAQVAARTLEMLAGRSLAPMALGFVAVGTLPLAFLLLMLLGATPVTALAFALVYGASNGLVTIMRGVVPLYLFGAARIGRMLGWIASPALLVKALAPATFAAFLADFSAPAGVRASALIGMLAVAALVIIAIRARRPRP